LLPPFQGMLKEGMHRNDSTPADAVTRT